MSNYEELLFLLYSCLDHYILQALFSLCFISIRYICIYTLCPVPKYCMSSQSALMLYPRIECLLMIKEAFCDV